MANPTLLLKKSTVAGKVPTTSDLQAGEICLNFADAKIFGRHPGNSSIVTFTGGGGGSGPSTPSDSYTEPTFTGGVLTSMTTWSDSTKTVLVQTKTFSYTAGNLTQITTADATGTTTLTKTITYSGDNLASITEDYA